MFLALVCLSASRSEFILTETIWPKEGKPDLFGRSVSCSNDGKRIVISASNSDVSAEHPFSKNGGCAYVYDFNPTTNQHQYVATLIADHSDDYVIGDFGSRVLISPDGKTIASSSPKLQYKKELCTLLNDSFVEVDHNDDVVVHQINGKDVEFINELGGVFIFNQEGNDPSKWKQSSLQIPNEYAIPQGGYGRSLAASVDLNYIGAAYFNKLVPDVPDILGQAFVSMKGISTYTISPPVERPEQIDSATNMRFGGALAFNNGKYYVTTRAKGEVIGGTFIYTDNSNTNNWEIQYDETINFSTSWYNYGGLISIISENLIAIQGQNQTANKKYCPDQGIDFIQRVGGKWDPVPVQTLYYPAKDFYLTNDMSSCVFGDKVFFQVSLMHNETDKTKVYMYQYIDGKFEEIQRIYEPEVISPFCVGCTNYTEQEIIFASGFDWDKSTCSKFYVGAMSKSGSGKKYKAHNFSRVFEYQLNIVDDSEKKDKTALIAGTTVGAVIVVIIIIVVVIVCIRKKADNSASSDRVNA